MYYGDELGMHDVPIPHERIQDPWEKRVPGLGLGRDPERTPMQWSAEPHAGFTTGTPWLPLADDCATINLAAQRAEPRSMLSLYRALIDLRRREPALSLGNYQPVNAAGPVLAYLRQHHGHRLLVALNFGSEPAYSPMPAGGGRVLLSTHLDRKEPVATERVPLRADEGVVVALASA